MSDLTETRHANIAIGVAQRLLAWLCGCQRRHAERQTLSEMDDWQLRDIGVTRAELERELARWPWEGRRRDC